MNEGELLHSIGIDASYDNDIVTNSTTCDNSGASDGDSGASDGDSGDSDGDSGASDDNVRIM